MVTEIATLFNDLNLEKIRVARPSKFLFLCGGARELNEKAKAANLRDYLLRVRPMHTRYSIVLAEEANQLYRDTDYSDLITFEEDIARIAAVVLVIAESAGSLAELGAFTANDTIRQALRVVIPSHHETQESFVRYGPIQRLKNENLACCLKPAHISVIRGPRVKPEDDPRTHGKEAQLFRCSRGILARFSFNDEHPWRSSWIRSE